jgi:hypothetical protein
MAAWLNACAHTGTPDQSKPEMEKPAENTSENRTPPLDQTEAKPQESGDKSQAGQPPSQNESGASQQESRKNAQSNQLPPEPVTGPKSDLTPNWRKPVKIYKPAGKLKNGSLLILST